MRGWDAPTMGHCAMMRPGDTSLALIKDACHTQPIDGGWSGRVIEDKGFRQADSVGCDPS